MFLSMNWIRDFVNLDGVDLDDLIHKFTLGTAEVEGVEHVGRDIQNVVVGQILSCEKHPNSNKLHLLKVDGGDRIYDVVCGAPNAREGIKVPLCKVGGMAGGMKIEARPLAGYLSEGMCCSKKELGVSDDHSGLWELDMSLPVGKDLKEIYEIEDTVFEVDNKSLTNRPDLWGHYGIAREIAALANRPLKPYEVADLTPYNDLPKVPITIEDKELCYRYSGMAIQGITVPESPVNMQIRLFRCGMRGINLLADLTNYLMLEYGQPMHAFDYKRVNAIEVGHLENGGSFTTLDDKERKILPETLMIKSHGTPVAVAGIMGGLESEIVEDTTSLLLESANFDAVSVRKSSQALGLRTDASMRYEKTLDPEMTTVAIARFMKLLQDIDPGVEVISSLTDEYVKHYPVREITFDKPYVDRITGINISEERIEKTLTDLGFHLTRDGKDFHVVVPSWRATKDVTIKADIIEEITRIYGYDNFEITTAKVKLHPMPFTAEHQLHRDVKDLMAFTYGAHEVHSYVWNDGKRLAELGLSNTGHLHLTNSVSPDIDTIRSEMVPTLLTVCLKNRGYAPSYSIFEIGSVITGVDENNLGREEKHLAVVLYGRKGEEAALVSKAKSMMESIANLLRGAKLTYANIDPENVATGEEEGANFGKIKEWQHPYNSFVVSVDMTEETPVGTVTTRKEVGTIALVHPTVAGKIEKKAAAVALELNLDLIYPLAKAVPMFNEPSRFPEVTNDITFIVDSETPYCAFEEELKKVEVPILTGADLVGIYRDNAITGKKSVTIRYTFGSKERTLSADEVADAAGKIREQMKALGAVTIG